MDFSFNGYETCDCSSLNQTSGRVDTRQIPNGYEFAQSTQQAFYFIEDISLDGIELTQDDYLIAMYNGHVVGARAYNGPYTDIPVMGFDPLVVETQNYIIQGEYPSIYILKDNELYEVSGDVPAFGNNETFIVSLSEIDENLPESFELYSPYPNPFNPSTTISYAINQSVKVDLAVYNTTGQKVDQLVNDIQSSGYYSVKWDGEDFSSGLYFVRMQVGSKVYNQKLLLVK